MESRKILQIVILGLWMTIAWVVVIKPKKSELTKPEIQETSSLSGKTFNVKRIAVKSGHQFDIVLQDDTKIIGSLNLLSTENSKFAVSDFLHKISLPKVKLKNKKSNGEWQIDFMYTENGEEKSLEDWLNSENLVYK